MSDPTANFSQANKDALDHAWRWFELLAKQRMDMLNYFIVSVTFLVAGYAAGIQAEKPYLSLGVGTLGLIVTYCFRKIESRTRELVKVSEVALAEAELRLSEATGMTSAEVVLRGEAKGPGIRSYAFVLRILHAAIATFFFCGIASALYLSLT